MPFKPGHTLSTGRPKGSQNKTSEKIRVAIDALLEGHLEGLTEVLGQLRETNPVKYADTVLRLMEYSIPKQRAVESTVDFGSEAVSKITVELKQKNGDNNTGNTGVQPELGEQ